MFGRPIIVDDADSGGSEGLGQKLQFITCVADDSKYFFFVVARRTPDRQVACHVEAFEVSEIHRRTEI